MKRALVSAFLAFLLSAPFGPPAAGQDAARVLLFIRGGSADWAFMLNREVGVMKTVLEEAGIEVAIATASGDPITAGSITVTPDLRVGDVNVADYDAFILPCMAAGNFIDPGAVEMVKEAAAAGKIVAAQYNSIATLAEAGLLKGKTYAYSREIDPVQYPTLEGASYGGGGVVRDGNIITSGLCPYMARQRGVPDQTAELAQLLADAILQ